ncbi:MAG: CIA30 family protein [Pseudomonadota bacterium]
MTCQPLNPSWRYVADTVMGGVSTGQITPSRDGAREAMRLTGRVSLDNNGGFIQMAAGLGGQDAPLDASGFTGLSMEVRGNGERYHVGLRTTELSRPWQSYRAVFDAPGDWTKVTLPFAAFEPNRTDLPFNPRLLRRIGVLAIGREFDADVSVANVCFVT